MRFGVQGLNLLVIQLSILFGIPILGVGITLLNRMWSRRIRTRISGSDLSRLTLSLSIPRRRLKLILILLGFAFVLFSLMRPQWGARSKLIDIRGTDIIVVLDSSLSMDAKDLPPSRLAKAKHEIGGILDKLESDRVGLVAFAGSAFVQCPLTSDYSALRLFLDALDTNVIVDQGTNISAALDTAIRAFGRDEPSYKLILLFTDGEETVGEPLEAAERASDAGVIVYTVGLGSSSGEPIPVRTGKQNSEYKRNKDGQVVVSRLDEKTLQKVAKITGGNYFRASGSEREIDTIADIIAGSSKRDLESRLHTQYAERYQLFLLLGVIILSIEGILTDRRRHS